jgi:GNAT superfamily N-acetyltransferase
MFTIVNNSAEAYRGFIPAECWKEPYMPLDELRDEIKAGILFWGHEEAGELVGIMGMQDVGDITLIRHAYVISAKRNQGIGGKLISYLLGQNTRPKLVGTWEAASWAIRFYEKYGFQLIEPEERKNKLLEKYWPVSRCQIETSVVLADEKWFRLDKRNSA